MPKTTAVSLLLSPSSEKRETWKWPHVWLKARDGRGAKKESSHFFFLGGRPCFSRFRARLLPWLNLRRKRDTARWRLRAPIKPIARTLWITLYSFLVTDLNNCIHLLCSPRYTCKWMRHLCCYNEREHHSCWHQTEHIHQCLIKNGSNESINPFINFTINISKFSDFISRQRSNKMCAFLRALL